MRKDIRKGELTAYLGVLKTIAKSSNLETLKGIAILDGNLQATNLDITATLKADIQAEDCIYDSNFLDLLKVREWADPTPYKVQPIIDWVEARPQEFGEEINLDTRHSRGTLGEIIIHAFGFVSTDSTRPNLMSVWSDKGEIVATDGYRAYASGSLAELDGMKFSLTTEVIKHLKKIIKYGGFKLRFNDQMVEIENDFFKLRAPMCAKAPAPVRDLMNSNRSFSRKLFLPYRQLKPLFNKTNKELEVKPNGTLVLENRPLQIPIPIIEVDPTYEYDEDHCRALLCGLRNGGLRFDATLLSAFTTNQDGNIILRYNENSLVFGIDEPLS